MKFIAIFTCIVLTAVAGYAQSFEESDSFDPTGPGPESRSGGLLDMVPVEAGRFYMGFGGRGEDTAPMHEVRISRDFSIGRYEVTQEQYLEVMGTNPSTFSGKNLPVESVTWFDAVKFCNRLSEREGLTKAYSINSETVTWDSTADGYRLPTEAEWEYAARGGTGGRGYAYPGSDSIGDVAWYWDNAHGQTQPVGEKKANELGLYDMTGNVREWCWDWYEKDYYGSSPDTDPRGPANGMYELRPGPFGDETGPYRVIRGGCVNNNLKAGLSVTDRFSMTDSSSLPNVGFRPVRSLNVSPSEPWRSERRGSTVTIDGRKTVLIHTDGRVTDNLNIRLSPTTKASKLEYMDSTGKTHPYIPTGTTVRVIGRTEYREKIGDWYNYWYLLEVPADTTGSSRLCWAFAEFIELFEPMAGLQHGGLLDMVLVKAGTFEMGSAEPGEDTAPVHEVRISRDFSISRHEVTQEQYLEVMGTNPSTFSGDHLPVESVTWFDAVKFCNRLSEREGLTNAYSINGETVTWDSTADGYRLPTEAEWEYAAGGGSRRQGYPYAGSDSAGEVAWYWDNARGHTQAVGQKKPNELGLYDMTGNVEEWCWDWFDENYYISSPDTDPRGPSTCTNEVRENPLFDDPGPYRVLRGGCVNNGIRGLRVTGRFSMTDSNSFPNVGFRPVRSLH